LLNEDQRVLPSVEFLEYARRTSLRYQRDATYIILQRFLKRFLS